MAVTTLMTAGNIGNSGTTSYSLIIFVQHGYPEQIWRTLVDPFVHLSEESPTFGPIEGVAMAFQLFFRLGI